jgi:deoxyribonuclease-4
MDWHFMLTVNAKMKKVHLGLKLGSNDLPLCPEALALYREHIFDYIEIYVVPGSYNSTISEWKSLRIPVIIHAPHTAHGVNLADCNLKKANLAAYEEVKQFADTLSAQTIIVHAGSDGTVDEVINQLALINDRRIKIENKPKKGLGEEICRGCSPEEFGKIFGAGVVSGFVLDFGHAVYYAAWRNLDYRTVIKGFLVYRPSVFHISDGKYGSHTDIHLNIGKGDFNIKEMLSYVPENAYLCLETPRNSSEDLHEFLEDIQSLRRNL